MQAQMAEWPPQQRHGNRDGKRGYSGDKAFGSICVWVLFYRLGNEARALD